jgi:dephospho-CoA kinase
MIKLRTLLNEINGEGPKAIFMAGPAGAGKSFILEQLNIEGFKTINVDDDFEELLKQEFGDDINFSKMSPEQLSQAAKFMGTARKTTREKEIAAIESLQNIVIDGTGAASNPLLKKKAELEALGYKTFMILIYVSPMTSLKRNAERGRSLVTSAVLSSWKGLASNIALYRDKFGSNIVVINNDPEDVDKTYDPEKIMQLFPSPKGKPKTPEELAKSKVQKDELNAAIKDLVAAEREFDTFDEAKTKVAAFVNA